MLRAILVVLFLGYIASTIFPSKVEEASDAPPSPEALAAQEARKAKDARLLAAMRAGRVIKSNLRDPDSLKFQTIVANDDGTVICFIYRAKNGFGGMNVEHATLADNTISKTSKTWNKHCSDKSMHDVTSARAGI